MSQPNSMRTVAWASLIGTTIEFYDFLIYGTAAALVFNKVFFPALGAAAGTALAFATLGVAFVARPFGSVLFGHFGDRIGRKKTLVATLLLMGLATVAVGLLPTTAVLGPAAPVLLVLLRICQGLAVGGEWAGATLLTAENAPAGKRGSYALFPQLGPALGFVLASATFLITSLFMSGAAFVAWGWRVPFVCSVVLIGVGLFVRTRLRETAVYTTSAGAPRSLRPPIIESFTRQPKQILLGAGTATMCFAFYYFAVTYLSSYGTAQLKLSRQAVLIVGIIAGVALAAATIISARASDRLGRRRVGLYGNTLAIVSGLVLFPILSIGTIWAFAIAACLAMVCVGSTYGPIGALLPEVFATRYRYTGAGIAYNLAGVIGGAVTPLLATQLVSSAGGYYVGVYLSAVGLLSLLCQLALGESKQNTLADVDHGSAPALAVTER